MTSITEIINSLENSTKLVLAIATLVGVFYGGIQGGIFSQESHLSNKDGQISALSIQQDALAASYGALLQAMSEHCERKCNPEGEGE